MRKDSEFCIVLTTVDNSAQAREIARQLVKQKLVACVNMVDKVSSVYQWQGEIEESTEILLILKTRWQNWQSLSAKIAEIHPYEVPELVAIDIEAGSKSYLGWLAEMTTIDQ